MAIDGNWKRATSSTLVRSGRGSIHVFVLTSGATATARARFHDDGSGSGSGTFLELACGSNDSKIVSHWPAVLHEKGLYAHIDGEGASVSVI